jgi:hypothetical protein
MSKLLPILDPFAEIKRLYFTTTRQTIERDLARALDLLTRMPSEEDRERVAGYMHGLADLRREWNSARPTPENKAHVRQDGGRVRKGERRRQSAPRRGNSEK